MVCGPGEGARYLSKTLADFGRLCDEIVVACNNTDPLTEAMLRSAGAWVYRDDREWGRFQPAIKTDLLRKIAKLKPDWIIPLDADEVFSPEFTREALEELSKTNALAYYFYIVNLWNDETRYWPGASFWNVRAFRFRPDLGLEFLKKNVHCGLAPPWAYQYGRYAPFHVKHYGLMRAEDRAKKVARYKLYDPRSDKVGIGAYYEALASTGNGTSYSDAELQARVRAEVAKMRQPDKVFNTMSASAKKFVYALRLKDGVTLDMTAAEWERISQDPNRRKQFELVREIDLEVNTAINTAVEDDKLECPLCGAVSATEADLAAHKDTHNIPAPVNPINANSTHKLKPLNVVMPEEPKPVEPVKSGETVPLACAVCGKVAKNVTGHKLHAKTHA